MSQSAGSEPERLRILRLHKSWDDRYALIRQIIVFALFSGVYLMLEQSGMDAAGRVGVFAFLAVMVLAAAIWQAVGVNGLDCKSRLSHS